MAAIEKALGSLAFTHDVSEARKELGDMKTEIASLREQLREQLRLAEEHAALIRRLADHELAHGGKVWGKSGWHTYYCHARRQCDAQCRLTQDLLRAAGIMIEPEKSNG